jgi:uncharacterized membrane protein YqjE
LTTVSDTLSFSSADKATDEVAKLAATKANPQFVDTDRLMGARDDTATYVGREATRLLSFWGVGKEALSASMAMPALIAGLPMAQALTLMGLYMLMPLMIFFAGYDLRAMLIGTVAIFTVKFFAALWAIAQWVDANLINAMYPGMQGGVIMQEFAQMSLTNNPSAGYKRMLLNTLLMLMFFGLPMLWMGMMGWIGMNMSHGLNGMMSAHSDSTKNSSKAPSIPKIK